MRRREGEAGEGARVCGEFRRSRAASRGSEGGGRRESARRSAGWMKVVREKRASVRPNWRSGGKENRLLGFAPLRFSILFLLLPHLRETLYIIFTWYK